MTQKVAAEEPNALRWTHVLEFESYSNLKAVEQQSFWLTWPRRVFLRRVGEIVCACVMVLSFREAVRCVAEPLQAVQGMLRGSRIVL